MDENATIPPVQNTQGNQPDSPRITLNDLYGPSNPGELPQQTSAEQPIVQQSVVEQPPAQAEPPTPEPPAPQQPAPENTIEVKAGFNFSSIIKFAIGGIALLLVIFLIFGIMSLFSKHSANGNATLTYWGLWEDSNVMQPILDEFHKEHPDITVNYIKEDPKQYTDRLLTRMQQGDGPDIFTINNTWVYPLRDVLLPLPTSVIDTKSLSSNYPPVVAQDLVNNGAVYSLPMNMDVLSLFVNTDIFKHAGAGVPTTWDNFITVAKALTVKDPAGHIQTAGASLGTYNNIEHAPDILSLLLLQNGADVQKLGNSSNATDALSFYTSFATGEQNVWDNTLDNSLLAFESGKLAMYFGYSYDIFAIQAANPSLNFSVNPVPHLSGRNITIANYWATSVSSKSKNQKAALEFMQYLAQKSTQTNLYTQEAKTRAFGELYPQLDLAQNLSANQLLHPFISQYKDAESSFFIAGTDYTEYNDALNQYLGNAVNSVLQNTSADSAMSTLAQGVSQVLGNYAPKTQ